MLWRGGLCVARRSKIFRNATLLSYSSLAIPARRNGDRITCKTANLGQNKNGEGPSVLLSAGVHGDEYEGQLALMKLCQPIDPEEVRGRIVMLTAAKFSAAIAGLRTSPIDDLNLNRAFPGQPDEVIVHGTPCRRF